MVVKIAAILWYAYLVILAVLGVKFHVAIVVQKDQLRERERERSLIYLI